MSGNFKYLCLLGHDTKYLENGLYSTPSCVYISYSYKPFSKYNLIMCLSIRTNNFYFEKKTSILCLSDTKISVEMK